MVRENYKKVAIQELNKNVPIAFDRHNDIRETIQFTPIDFKPSKIYLALNFNFQDGYKIFRIVLDKDTSFKQFMFENEKLKVGLYKLDEKEANLHIVFERNAWKLEITVLEAVFIE